MMAAEIFGRSHANTLEYARELGLAFQLTNIVRDVGEDARRNRIYLPLDELASFGVSADQVLKFEENAQFTRLMAFQIERARQQYEYARAVLPAVDRREQRPGLVMASIYQTLLGEIAKEPGRVLNQRVSLTPVRKLWLAWKGDLDHSHSAYIVNRVAVIGGGYAGFAAASRSLPAAGGMRPLSRTAAVTFSKLPRYQAAARAASKYMAWRSTTACTC